MYLNKLITKWSLDYAEVTNRRVFISPRSDLENTD